jgi:hypothetical protein
MAKKTTTRKKTRGAGKRKTTTTQRKTRIVTARGTLDIQNGLGRMSSARSIAKSIKRAADAGSTLKKSSYEAAMAAVAYLIRHLEKQLIRLYDAQGELRRLYGQTVEHEEEPQRRLRIISNEKTAVRVQRKRGRKKIDLAGRLN